MRNKYSQSITNKSDQDPHNRKQLEIKIFIYKINQHKHTNVNMVY